MICLSYIFFQVEDVRVKRNERDRSRKFLNRVDNA